MAEESKKKDFGEGIEVVKDTHAEEKDIEINFGKILSFFKKNPDGNKKEEAPHTHQPKHEKSDDDADINLQSVGNFLKRWGAPILIIFGLLITLGLTVDVRLQPEKLPFADDWAKNSVYGTIQSDIQNAINTQYPNLPDDRKSQILADELNKARAGEAYTFKTGQYAGQSINVQDQIEGTSNIIKDFYKDETGKPYSPDIDPYYWYRYAKNIIQTGHIGDEVRNGLQWDNHQVAPLGREVASYDFFFPYFIADLYKFVRFFNHSADLFGVQTTVYPALLTAITVLLIFMIGRKIAGNTGGFFAALMGGLHAAYVNRTIHGDNDAVVVFFAILILWCFVQAIYSRKATWQIAFGALAGVSVYLFNLAWGGWYFILVFILAAAAAAIGAGLLRSVVSSLRVDGLLIGTGFFLVFSKKSLTIIGRAIKKEFGSQMVRATLAFLASTIALVGISKFLIIKDLLLGVTQLKTPVITSSYWPNVLTTVAELNPGSFEQVLSQIGPIIFWLSAGSALLLAGYAAMNFGLFREQMKGFVPSADKALYSVFFATLTVTWFVGTIYASTKGIRFVLLLAPMVGLGFGTTLGLFHRIALWINEKIIKADKTTIILQGTSYAAVAVLEYFFLKNKLMGTLNTLFGNSATLAYWLIFILVLGLVSYLSWWLIQKVRGSSFSTTSAIGALVFLVILIPVAANGPISNAYTIAKNDVPIMNDAWYDSLITIKNDSQPSAIITSWWDFGHHFKAITDRRVTFDGTTQQYPPAHWVGKLFMTKSETEAAGILRMLDCGSNTAFDEVNKIESDFHSSIDIVSRLTTIPSKADAKSVLVNEYKFTDEQAENVLNYTHCEPPEGYVIASEDMIGKSGVWGHFGSWDFEKAVIWQTLKNNRSQKDAVDFMMERFNYSEEKARKTYNDIRTLKDDSDANSWIAPWPSYSSDMSGCGVYENRTMVRCNNGLVVNLTNNDAYFPVQEGKIMHPETFVYVTNDGGKESVAEKVYTTDIVPQRLSIILVPQGSGYYAVAASPEQAGGMFTRMFFLGGIGLEHFKLLSHEQGLTGTNVYAYKALWDTLK